MTYRLGWTRYDERGREMARGVVPLCGPSREYAEAWAERLTRAGGGLVWEVLPD